MSITLASKQGALPLVLENSAFPGVVEIAKKVALDVKSVADVLPVVQQQENIPEKCVFVATLGNSALLKQLEEQGEVDLKGLCGKREVFLLQTCSFGLVIAGSDKLGTIYGLFALSEYIGVSPQVYFGDAKPLQKEVIEIDDSINRLSKEPSVKYRGFFINDEWPCFGNWTFGHFDGFTAKMYDHVFEFLLRMKGNYLWPAMWTSSFPLDGPGPLNEELADMYGITIGFSHHEPCLRASEEWDKVRGENSIYGNEWNFYTNKEGLTNYWADGLKRSGKYKHLITIGMRGERDSSMLGPDATLKDNIDLLKEIITTQRGLIGKYVNEDVDKAPQLLALYKEVEAYFYGDENTTGLKEWDELENVIFMLCEDNFGHMRTLPTKEIRDHKGGFGMYYHFDYHGGPISYEWMPSTTLALTWEQMTQAYEYGIRDVWIVNVGDLKGNEVALQYFLTLAYDFDTWGTTAVNSWRTYLKQWAESIFPGATKAQQEEIAWIYETMVQLNFMRRPEALNEKVYHPAHYNEAERMLLKVAELEQRTESLYAAVEEPTKQAVYSMIAHPVRSSVNLLRMHLYAGKNAFYAMQGRKEANKYGEKLSKAIAEDKKLSEAFGTFLDGKWKGMELEAHVGFTKWNDDGWRYPVRSYVEPVTRPRMSVSRSDNEYMAVKNYGTPSVIMVPDFATPGAAPVGIEISNDGVDSITYTIKAQQGEIPGWLSVSSLSGTVESLETVVLSCKEEALPETEETVRLLVSDGDTTVAVDVSGKKFDGSKLETMTFIPREDVVVMDAHHFAKTSSVGEAKFTHLEGYGRTGNGMKVLPATIDFTEQEEKPTITYRFLCENPGEYEVQLWSAPGNSLVNGRPLRVVCNAAGKEQILEVLSKDYKGGENSCWQWCKNVIEQIRVTSCQASFEKGVQEISVSPLEAGYVLERVVVVPVGKKLPGSYLGPMENYFVK